MTATTTFRVQIKERGTDAIVGHVRARETGQPHHMYVWRFPDRTPVVISGDPDDTWDYTHWISAHVSAAIAENYLDPEVYLVEVVAYQTNTSPEAKGDSK